MLVLLVLSPEWDPRGLMLPHPWMRLSSPVWSVDDGGIREEDPMNMFAQHKPREWPTERRVQTQRISPVGRISPLHSCVLAAKGHTESPVNIVRDGPKGVWGHFHA